MPSPLEALYAGPMAALMSPGLGEPPPSALAARELLEPGRLSARLDHFSHQYDRGDRRAVASLWSKWHLSAVISAGLAANLLLERDLPLGLDELYLELAAEGQTRRLWLAHDGTPLATQDPFVRFATLTDAHLTPLIAALAAHSGASPKVFWSNAGNYFEYFAEALEAHPMASPGAAEPARELLAARQLPDGRRNPLYQPVRYLADAAGGEPERRRRLCCIRYLIPELGYCGNCPLERGNACR